MNKIDWFLCVVNTFETICQNHLSIYVNFDLEKLQFRVIVDNIRKMFLQLNFLILFFFF